VLPTIIPFVERRLCALVVAAGHRFAVKKTIRALEISCDTGWTRPPQRDSATCRQAGDPRHRDQERHALTSPWQAMSSATDDATQASTTSRLVTRSKPTCLVPSTRRVREPRSQGTSGRPLGGARCGTRTSSPADGRAKVVTLGETGTTAVACACRRPPGAHRRDAGVLRPLTDRKRDQVWGAGLVLDELDDLGVRIVHAIVRNG
jgi:hypothetical protein